MAGGAEFWRLLRDMSTTAAEFERAFRLAAPAPVDSLADGGLQLAVGAVRLTVRLRDPGQRIIAGIILPRLTAEYEMIGPREEAEALLARLDLAMRRGGG